MANVSLRMPESLAGDVAAAAQPQRRQQIGAHSRSHRRFPRRGRSRTARSRPWTSWPISPVPARAPRICRQTGSTCKASVSESGDHSRHGPPDCSSQFARSSPRMGARAVGRDRTPVAFLRASGSRGVFSRPASHPGGQSRVLDILRRGALDVSFSLSGELDAVDRLVKKYRDVPMSLADACLVRMSELHQSSPVLTLDRDFTIYRRSRRQRIPLLSPGGDPACG